MKQFFIVKKNSSKNWTGFESELSLEELKKNIKRGYQLKGPYKNFVASFIAANQAK